jgi:hypothetical protein
MSLRSKDLADPDADVLLSRQLEQLASNVSDVHNRLLRKLLDLEQCRKHAPVSAENLRSLLRAAERAKRAVHTIPSASPIPRSTSLLGAADDRASFTVSRR